MITLSIFAIIAVLTTMWVRRTFNLTTRFAIIVAAVPLGVAMVLYYFLRGARKILFVTVRDLIGAIAITAVVTLVLLMVGSRRKKPNE